MSRLQALLSRRFPSRETRLATHAYAPSDFKAKNLGETLYPRAQREALQAALAALYRREDEAVRNARASGYARFKVEQAKHYDADVRAGRQLPGEPQVVYAPNGTRLEIRDSAYERAELEAIVALQGTLDLQHQQGRLHVLQSTLTVVSHRVAAITAFLEQAASGQISPAAAETVFTHLDEIAEQLRGAESERRLLLQEGGELFGGPQSLAHVQSEHTRLSRAVSDLRAETRARSA